jgi:hypothetical protein
MKKMVCILLMMTCAGMVFAQAKAADPAVPAAAPETAPAPESAKNGIALDLFPLFKGIIASDSSGDEKISYFCIAAGYERLIVPHLSIGAALNLYFGNYKYSVPGFSLEKDGNYFSLAGELRIYPQSEDFEKAFVGATLGFNMLSLDGKSDPKDGGFTGLTTSLKAGYKLITSKGIYIEPSLSYVLSKSSFLSGGGGGDEWGNAGGHEGGGGTLTIPTPLGWEGGFRIGFAF